MSRKKGLPAISMAEWLAAVETLPAEQVHKVPAGWITAEAFGDEIGRVITTARCYLRALVKSGKAERQKYRVMTDHGPHYIWHYKLK